MNKTQPRSALFVPGHNARAIEKARTLAADAIIFDLEDSVHVDQRPLARQQVADALTAGGYQAGLLLVRIPALDQPESLAELRAACLAGADGIVLPKVETAAAISQAHQAMLAAGGSKTSVLWAMIETPLGLLHCAEIAAMASTCPLAALMIGPNDVVRTTGVTPGPDRVNLLPWLMQIVLAGKAYGLVTIDGVYNNFNDEAGFVAECHQARTLGFDGKALIHPRQVEPAHAAFRPRPAEIEWAQAVKSAFEAPDAGAINVVSINGEMVERLHLDIADDILRRASL